VGGILLFLGISAVLPDIISAFLIFAGGFLFLSKGSDLFVESIARIAKTFGISEFIIGLTVIAIGTSLPELLTGITSSLTGNPELVLGTAVGSNITNISLIIGLTSTVSLILINREIFYRDCYILLGISFLFYFFAYDSVITNIDGLILIGLFLFYIAFLFRFKPSISFLYNFQEYLDFVYGFDTLVDFSTYKRILLRGLDFKTHQRLIRAGLSLGWKLGTIPISLAVKGLDGHTYVSLIDSYKERLRKNLVRDFMIFIIGAVAIYIGAKYFVKGAVYIADILNVGQSIIGLTIVSLGTSLPELAVSIKSARRGLSNMVLGNVMGSNIANITLVIGASALILPINIPDFSISYVIPFMILMTFLLILFIRSGWHIRRLEGIIFLILYLVFLACMAGIVV